VRELVSPAIIEFVSMPISQGWQRGETLPVISIFLPILR
jgi:hypothetical protein